jgi:hypothetical protein
LDVTRFYSHGVFYYHYIPSIYASDLENVRTYGDNNEMNLKYVARMCTALIWLRIKRSGQDHDVNLRFHNICMYKGWAIKVALAPRPLMIYLCFPFGRYDDCNCSCPAYCTCTWKQANIAC